MCIFVGVSWRVSVNVQTVADLMLLEEMEYRNTSFSPKDRRILLLEVTFDRHGVQEDANSLKLRFLIWRWDSCGVGHGFLQPSWRLSSLAPPSFPSVASQLCSTASLSLVKVQKKQQWWLCIGFPHTKCAFFLSFSRSLFNKPNLQWYLCLVILFCSCVLSREETRTFWGEDSWW